MREETLAYSFDQFLEYGRENASSVVDGVPWAFHIHGFACTHEGDNAYVIAGQMLFRRGDYLIVRKYTIDSAHYISAVVAVGLPPSITVRMS